MGIIKQIQMAVSLLSGLYPLVQKLEALMQGDEAKQIIADIKLAISNFHNLIHGEPLSGAVEPTVTPQAPMPLTHNPDPQPSASQPA